MRKGLACSIPAGRNSRENPGDVSVVARHVGRGSEQAEVAELPGIAAAELIREEILPLLKRRPVGIDADDLAQIGTAERKDLKRHFVRVDNAALRIAHGPYHPRQHARSNL